MSPCKTSLPITAFHPEQQKKVQIDDTFIVNEMMSGQLERFTNLLGFDNAKSGKHKLAIGIGLHALLRWCLFRSPCKPQ